MKFYLIKPEVAGGFTGFSFGDVEVSKSILFTELYPKRKLPKFVWLKVNGRAGFDDFGIAIDRKCRLAVSEKGLNTLKEFNLNHCGIEAF
ncbi:MAG TPA: hypothetical protein DET40_25425 [Lentisphaeria bacterium]|nr:MAG: hypothetical protein A2X45_18540 [Lentisphaerae bacterium GWF2_50_93]HCE46902.1 hypothetical protein [Lentisphaeria bacterium]